MSKIISERGKIRLIGGKYGILPTPTESPGIILPIRLRSEDEVDKLVQDIHKFKESFPGCEASTSFTNRGLEILVKGNDTTIAVLSMEPEASGTAIYLREGKGIPVLDFLLQETILRDKLVDYWMRSEGISKMDAEGRINEISIPPIVYLKIMEAYAPNIREKLREKQ